MSEAAIHPEADGLSNTMDLAVGAARRGAADAREAADRVVASAGLFVSRFVYTTCYTVSYGVVFPTMLVARAVPKDNPVVRGFIDGAHAADHRAAAMSDGAVDEDI